MATPSIDFIQCGQALSDIVKNAGGQGTITETPITTPQDFVRVATVAYNMGMDKVLNSVANLGLRTMFSVRSYKGSLSTLERSLAEFGGIERKLTPVTMDNEKNADPAYTYPCAYSADGNPPSGGGKSVDQWSIAKQDVLQTFFVGASVYSKHWTIFDKQYRLAFSSPNELGQFLAMNFTQRNNEREYFRVAVARGLQANYIAAILKENQVSSDPGVKTNRVIKLIAEYNAATGLSLDSQTVHKPENFTGFMRWAYARMSEVAKTMGQSSLYFQTVVDGKPTYHHTPPDKLRIAVNAFALAEIDSVVKSGTYHDKYLDTAKWEGVDCWQSPEYPMSIAVNPVYTDTNGEMQISEDTIENAHVFAVMHDIDAIGYAYVDKTSIATPKNAAGLYVNMWDHNTIKTYTDLTEKGVVFLLE